MALGKIERAEAKAQRTLMLRIVGKVDPSLKGAFAEADKVAREASQTISDPTERIKDHAEQLKIFARAFPDIWKKYIELVQKAGSAGKALFDHRMQDIRGMLEQRKAQEKQTAGLGDFIKALRSGKATFSDFIQAIGGGTTVLAAFGVALSAIGIKKIVDRLKAGFQSILTLLKNIGKAGIKAFKDLASAAVDVNSKFEQIEITLLAITRSEEAAAAYMRTIQNVAMATGRSMLELGAASRALIPITGGDPRQLEEMLNLALRLQMLRPEIPLRTATRAIGQFLTGRVDALVRTFQIPSELINQIQEQGLVGLEALQKIFEEMRLGQELIDGYANSWEGLNNTLEDFGQTTLRGITAPAFEVLRSSLEKLVNWLSTNSGQIETFASMLGTDLGAGVQQVASMIFGAEGFSEESLFRVAEWGANLIASLVHGLLEGVNNYLLPTLVQITELIASFLRGTSPPERGILATIDQWFGPIIQAYLSGFTAADFTALSDIGNIIKASLQTSLAVGAITQEQFTEGMLKTRSIMVQMVEDIRNFGQVSAGVWSSLGQYIGIDVQLIEGYLDLVNRVKAAMAGLAAAQAAMAAAQAAYAEAMKKVKRIQEELRLFELKTADIPERYKRGRRLEIEFRLMAAQKQAQLQQEAVTAAREQVKAAQAQLTQAKQMLSAYKQMITALQQLAKAAEDAVKAGEEEGVGIPEWIENINEAAREALKGPFLELWKKLHEAFEPVKEDLREIMDFFRGLLGLPTVEYKRGKDPVSLVEYEEAYELGERLRDAFVTIAENLPKIGAGFSSIVAGLQSIVDWYNGQPEWVQNIVGAIGKTVAIGIALHWITAGLSTGLAMILGSVGIKALSALGVTSAVATYGLPIVAVFAAVLGLTEILTQAAQGVGIEVIGPGDWIRGIKLRLEEGDTFIEAIQGTFDEIATRLADWLNNVIGPIWQSDPITAALIGFALGGIPGAIGLAQQAAGEGLGETWIESIQGAVADSGAEVAGTWIQQLRDTISGADKEVEEAAKKGIFDPITGVAQDVEDELTGESIFPDMMDEIVKLFKDMAEDLSTPLQSMVNNINTYGNRAYTWWNYYMVSMSNSLQGFVNNLYAAISAIQYYLATVAQMGGIDVTTPGEAPPGKTGPGFQMGGVIPDTGFIWAHAQEIILNASQQYNVAARLTGAMPQMGGVSPNVTVDQRNWRFAGALTEAERKQLKKMAKEASFEGIREAFTGAV